MEQVDPSININYVDNQSRSHAGDWIRWGSGANGHHWSRWDSRSLWNAHGHHQPVLLLQPLRLLRLPLVDVAHHRALARCSLLRSVGWRIRRIRAPPQAQKGGQTKRQRGGRGEQHHQEPLQKILLMRGWIFYERISKYPWMVSFPRSRAPPSNWFPTLEFKYFIEGPSPSVSKSPAHFDSKSSLQPLLTVDISGCLILLHLWLICLQ